MPDGTRSPAPDSEVCAALGLLDAQLAADVRDRSLPGLSAAVVYGNETLWQSGYGYADLARQTPAEAGTVYRVASITKLFTATAVMQLRDAGKLHLDDPLTLHLPEFALRPRQDDDSPIRLRHLLSHSSGLPREPYLEHWRTLDAAPIDTMLKRLNEQTPIAAPASEIHYSNIAFGLLGLVVERLAGQPFAEYMKEHVFDPLGMTLSGFVLSEGIASHLATGYYGTDEPETPVPPWDLGGLTTAGGLYSTVADMARFIAFQFMGNSRVLRESTLREMRQPVFLRPNSPDGFGIAWALSYRDGSWIARHGGSVYGFRSQMLLAPDRQLGVVIFTNTAYDPLKRCWQALDLLTPALERFRWRQKRDAEPSVVPDAWDAYCGWYRWRGFERIRVHIMRGELAYSTGEFASDSDVRLDPVSRDCFRVRGGVLNGERARFERDSVGQITSLWLGPYPYDREEDR